MIVELKRTKVTKSIVDQSLMGRYRLFYDWETFYDVLGWCMIKSGKSYLRYVLLYYRIDNRIIKLPFILLDKDIELYKEGVQRGDGKNGYTFPIVYKLKVRWANFNNSQLLVEQTDETDEQMEALFLKVKQFKKLVEQKGQIYL